MTAQKANESDNSGKCKRLGTASPSIHEAPIDAPSGGRGCAEPHSVKKNGNLNISSFITVLLIVAALMLASATQQKLIRLRSEHNLDPAAVVEDASPMINVVTVLLGGFRGLLADILWLRISYMQDQGQVLEVVQLADWVSKLQPQTPETWTFHAWNMAYNVSLLVPDAWDRWQWVLNGLDLLRNDGIRFNPADPRIYTELAWFFQHKIGGTSDVHNQLFKQWWARDMEELLGHGRHIDWDIFVQNHEKLERLRNEFRMNPVIMQEVEQHYGRMDWRIPESHAVYWAWRAKSFAPSEGFIRADRMLFQTLVTLMRQGTLHFDYAKGIHALSADPDRWPYVIKAYEEAMQRYPGNITIELPYLYQLWDAVLIMHAYGRDDYAQMAFERIRKMDDEAGEIESLEQAVQHAMERLQWEAGPIQVYSLINGFLYQAAVERKTGNIEVALQAESTAKELWQMLDSWLDAELRQRIGFEPFETLAQRSTAMAREGLSPAR